MSCSPPFATHVAFVASLVVWLLLQITAAVAASPNAELWYDSPAKAWTDALPVGNGSMGAMVFGGVAEASWQFNEDTIWTGGPRSYAHEGASGYLPEIRRLLFAGQQAEAEELAGKHFMSVPLRQESYQPCGDLVIKFAHGDGCDSYRRSLDLDAATANTAYSVDGKRYQRNTFATYVDGVIVIRLACLDGAKLAFAAELSSPHVDKQTTPVDGRTLQLTGRVRDTQTVSGEPISGQIRFASFLRIAETDGEVTQSDDSLVVSNASQATLLLAAATNYAGYRDLSADPPSQALDAVELASKQSADELYESHLQDHRGLYRRVSIQLSSSETNTALPTDQRIAANQLNHDPELAALLFNYGRYLMIASSRPGSQPANLQGVWNDQLQPPWGSKYTVNINTEMNYWLTDPCDLAECGQPLYAAIHEAGAVRRGDSTGPLRCARLGAPSQLRPVARNCADQRIESWHLAYRWRMALPALVATLSLLRATRRS